MGCYSSSTETDIFEGNFNTSSYSENPEIGLVKVGDMLYRESDIVNTTYTDPAVHTMFSGTNDTPRDSEFQRAVYNIKFSQTASNFTNLSEQSTHKSSYNSFSYLSEQNNRGHDTDKATAKDSLLIEQSDCEKATFINTEALHSPSLTTEEIDLERATFTNTTVMDSHSFEETNTELEKATFVNMTAMNSHSFVPEQADLEKVTFTNAIAMNPHSFVPEQADLEKVTFTNAIAMNPHSFVPEQTDLEKVTFTNAIAMNPHSFVPEQADLEKVTFTNGRAMNPHSFVPKQEELEKATFTTTTAMYSHSTVTEQADLEKVTFSREKPLDSSEQTDCKKAVFTNMTAADHHPLVEEQADLEKATYTNLVDLHLSLIMEKQQPHFEKDTYKNTTILSTDQNDLEKVTLINELYANSFIKQRKQAKERKISSKNKALFTDKTEEMKFEKAILTNKTYERIKCGNVKLPSDFVFIKPTNSPGKTVAIPRRKYSYQYDKTSSYRDFTDLQEPPYPNHVHIYDEIDISQEPSKPHRLAVNRTYMSLSDDCIFSVSNNFKKDNSFKSSSTEAAHVYESVAPKCPQ